MAHEAPLQVFLLRVEEGKMASDAYIAGRIQGFDQWCVNRGLPGGWPSFHHATYDNPLRTVYGHFIFKPNVLTWHSVPASSFGATDLRTRFTTAHDYAVGLGFQHGFPNFQEAVDRQGVEYGTYLVPNVATWQDVQATHLGLGSGDPTRHSMDAWFRGAADYAYANGFLGGMPNGHYANYGQGFVCGIFLFSSSILDWLDIRGQELGLPDPGTPSDGGAPTGRSGPIYGQQAVTFSEVSPGSPTWVATTVLPTGVIPSTAVIDRVHNTAKIPNSPQPNIPIKLSFLDKAGRPAGPIDVAPDTTVTGDFVGLSFQGQWTALPSLSATFNVKTFTIDVHWMA